MQNTLKRHPVLWAIVIVCALCIAFLTVALAPAIAGDTRQAASGARPAGPLYTVDMQVWRDRELLTNPTLTLPQNELAEITVDDPFIVPDKVKVTFRLANYDGALSARTSGEQFTVESTIFLPQNGAWEMAASPRLVVEKGSRSMVEIPVERAGFVHTDGRPVETLILFVLIDDPA